MAETELEPRAASFMRGVGCREVRDKGRHSSQDTVGKKSGRVQPRLREMRAPDTGLGGAAAMAARWPEIGQPAERKASGSSSPALGAAPRAPGPEGLYRPRTD